ncbi:hypothetical protein Daus18300_013930 [Diaporthe australafricana]|uniref:Amidoligase enzyme n=1 Tax=Diaporthe australafricana TaxID=127596 RepID=A0ABR3VX68_9PEZI
MTESITFGVELEILVAYQFENDPKPAEDMDKRQVVRISDAAMPEQSSITPDDRVRNALRDFLRSHDVPVGDNGEQEAGPPSKYSLGSDSSVREDQFQYYNWAGVELRSPALVAGANSFDDVKRVVNLLRNNFRLRVNESTGFHVHVGMGAQPSPPRAIRRLSQFLWCAEGMLSQLHPPDRVLSKYCQSIRQWSYLGQGNLDHFRQAEEDFAELRRYLGRSSPSNEVGDRKHPADVSDRLSVLQQNSDVFPALDSFSGSVRLQRLPATRINPYQDDASRQRHYIRTGRELERLTRREFLDRGRLVSLERGTAAVELTEECTPILDGLRVLSQPHMYSNTTRAAHELLGALDQRLNYNFSAYNFQVSGDFELRMTIEFREAAGSLDPSWIATWARICSRVVEFCLQTEEHTFIDILMRVLEAELAFESNEEGPRYDVIDLLNDLSLSDEARFVEERILLEDKNAFWFPCALQEIAGENHHASTLVAPEDEE